MAETSLSFLDSLGQGGDAAWRRLVDLYSPFIRGWLRRYASVPQDSDDLVQEVLLVVVRRFPEFQRGPHPGSFRRWLLEITVNCLRNYRRQQGRQPDATGGSQFREALQQLSDPGSALSRQWEVDHDRHIAGQLLERIRGRFEANTWAAFRATTLEGRSPSEVATELGITVNAVFIAKSRVLTALRQEGKGLLEE